MQALEVGKDYGSIFGLDAGKGCHLYYIGGTMWRAERPGLTVERDNAGATAKAIRYINQPSVQMGSIGAAYHR